MSDDTVRIEAHPCPACNAKLDRATCITDPGAGPSPDDVTVCLHCGTWLVFTDDLAVIKAPQEIIDQIDPIILKSVRQLVLLSHLDQA